MRGKIRQWLTGHPKITNAAFSLVLGYTTLAEYGVSPQEAAGGSWGP